MAKRRNWGRIVKSGGGTDLPSVIFVRSDVARILFERFRALWAQLDAPPELHRYFILPIKIALVQWMMLWEPESGMTRADWQAHWEAMQEIKHTARPAGIVYDGGICER